MAFTLSRKILITSVFLIAFGFECFALVSQEVYSYPQLTFSGYKRWLYSKFDVDPSKNYYLALQGLPLNSYLGGPWSEELELYIQGKLSDDLNVNYKLMQIPSGRDLFNVSLGFRNYSLLFGDAKALLSNQEYMLQDYMNGMVAGGRWDRLQAYLFSGIYPSGQFASPTENFSSSKLFRNPEYNGNKVSGSYNIDNPYLEYLCLDLGRADIIDESVAVFLDDKPLIRDSDFYFDEAFGLVLISGRFKATKAAKVNYLLKNGDKKESTFDFKSEAQRRAFLSPDFRIIDGSEIITVNNIKLTRDLDYRVNYNLGLFIMNKPLAEDAEVRIDYNYNYGANLYASETITGQWGMIFNVQHTNLIPESEKIIKNSQTLIKYRDYLISYTGGILTFQTALTAADTVEVSYSYTGIRQEIGGANVEYKLSDWSKIGSSVISISPSKKDEPLYHQIPPSSYLIWNLYHMTTLNKDTFINSEISFSNRNVDTRNNLTSEADSALKIFGRTRFGSVELNGTYRKTGLNFASLRKVKLNTGWREEKMDLGFAFTIGEYLTLKTGYESGINQEVSASSPEVSSSATYITLKPKPLRFLSEEFDLRMQQQKIPGSSLSPKQTTSSLYSVLDLNELLPTKSISEEFKLIYKYLYQSEQGEIGRPIVLIDSDKRYIKSQLGCLVKLFGAVSGYIEYKNEDDNDLLRVIETTRVTPFYKISYKFDFGGGHNLELFFDYSTTQQRGTTAYDKTEIGDGLVWNLPIANPVLSAFQLGTNMKKTDYTDLNDAANNYSSTELNFQGTMVF